MVEFGLFLVMIAFVVIVALCALGGVINDLFENVIDYLGEETMS